MTKGTILRIRILALLGAGLWAVAPAYAAKPAPTKKPPVKPAPAKKPAAPTGPIVLGTKQLPGDFGKFGATYTIGTYSPLNFTLRSAEYRVDRFVVGANSWGKEADEKLLVLHYTVHNPTKNDLSYYWAGLDFTAVDSQDVNRKFVQAAIRDGDAKRAPLNVTLKPAQKLDVVTAIVLPAEGVAPKLIVQRETGAAVIRYDLRGKVKALPAPFADPADETGATALQRVPALAGTYYPLGVFDVALETTGFTTDALSGQAPENGKRYFAATFKIKNPTNLPASYYWATFEATLKDADGETVKYNQTLLKASRDEKVNATLEPGDEARVRMFFELPDDLGAKSLWIREGQSRTLMFDVSGTQ